MKMSSVTALLLLSTPCFALDINQIPTITGIDISPYLNNLINKAFTGDHNIYWKTVHFNGKLVDGNNVNISFEHPDIRSSKVGCDGNGYEIGTCRIVGVVSDNGNNYQFDAELNNFPYGSWRIEYPLDFRINYISIKSLP